MEYTAGQIIKYNSQMLDEKDKPQYIYQFITKITPSGRLVYGPVLWDYGFNFSTIGTRPMKPVEVMTGSSSLDNREILRRFFRTENFMVGAKDLYPFLQAAH